MEKQWKARWGKPLYCFYCKKLIQLAEKLLSTNAAVLEFVPARLKMVCHEKYSIFKSFEQSAFSDLLSVQLSALQLNQINFLQLRT